MANLAGRSRAPRVNSPARTLSLYLQPGVFTVWLGGWHLAPESFGPLLLLPGPKSGSARAGAAVIDRAATARILGTDPEQEMRQRQRLRVVGRSSTSRFVAVPIPPLLVGLDPSVRPRAQQRSRGRSDDREVVRQDNSSRGTL